MSYSTQTRALRGITLPGYSYVRKSNGQVVVSGPGYDILDGAQSTYSWRTTRSRTASMEYEQMSGVDLKREINREYRDRYDTGHEFETTLRSWSWSHPSISIDNGNFLYHGLLAVSAPVLNVPVFQYPTETKITVDGTEAVRRTYPTRPEAGLTTALAELKQDVPRIPGLLLASFLHRGPRPVFRTRLDAARKKSGRSDLRQISASEYLNLEFGFLPTVRDIESLAQSVLKSSKVIEQMRRDSGRIVRRRAELYDDTTSVSFADVTISLAIGNVGGNNTRPFDYLQTYDPLCSVVDEVRQRAWFSGAYSYHLSQADSAIGRMKEYEQLANRLLGSRITPSTIWELTPWSWLADWFSDMGSIVTNISALHDDDLVLRYGYVMHETHAKRTWTTRKPLKSYNGSLVADALTLSQSFHRKKRTRSTPYGFGVDVSGLSPRRWAILGALGMSKSPGTLRND